MVVVQIIRYLNIQTYTINVRKDGPSQYFHRLKLAAHVYNGGEHTNTPPYCFITRAHTFEPKWAA